MTPVIGIRRPRGPGLTAGGCRGIMYVDPCRRVLRPRRGRRRRLSLIKPFTRFLMRSGPHLTESAPGRAARPPRWTVGELGILALAGVLLLLGVLLVATGGVQTGAVGSPSAPTANVTADKTASPNPVT